MASPSSTMPSSSLFMSTFLSGSAFQQGGARSSGTFNGEEVPYDFSVPLGPEETVDPLG